MTRIAVVDDDREIREMLAEILGEHHQVTQFAGGRALLEAAAATAFDLVLTDFNMPGMSGDQLVRELRGKGFATPVIVVSGGQSDERSMAQLLHLPGIYSLNKPFVIADVLAMVAKALHGAGGESQLARAS